MTGPARPRPRVVEGVASENDGAFSALDWALFCSIGMIWGSSFLLIDIGLDALEPAVITVLRIALGALVLVPFKASRRRIDRDDRTRLLVLSITWVAVPFTLFPLAEQHINSSVTGMLNGGTPIFTALFAAVLLKGRPAPAQAVGLVAGLAGVVVISLAQGGEGGNAWWGIAMVVFATICYGYSINLAAPLQRKYGALCLMSKMLGLATVLTVPFATAQLGSSRFELGPMLAVAALGAVGTGGAFVIMGTLVGRVGSTRAAFITYLIPVVAMGLGITIRGDSVRPVAVVGVAFVVAGALLASRGQRVSAGALPIDP